MILSGVIPMDPALGSSPFTWADGDGTKHGAVIYEEMSEMGAGVWDRAVGLPGTSPAIIKATSAITWRVWLGDASGAYVEWKDGPDKVADWTPIRESIGGAILDTRVPGAGTLGEGGTADPVYLGFGGGLGVVMFDDIVVEVGPEGSGLGEAKGESY